LSAQTTAGSVPILNSGEFAWETDTKKLRVGDGGTLYANLPYEGSVSPIFSGNLIANGNIVFNESGDNFDFRVEGDTNQNLLFTDASTDRVGIGTNAPASTLHVNGAILANGEIRASGNLVPATDNTGAVGTAALTWNNGQFTNLTVDSTLTVTSTLNVRAAIDLADNDILRFGDADDWEMYHNGTSNFIDLTVGDLFIRDDATAGDPVRMVIQRAGNVGIGTSSPTSILTVDSGNVVFNESGGNFDFRVEGDTDESLLLVDASIDRIGVGTSSPQAKLHVNGTFVANDVVTLGGGSIPLPRKPIELLNPTNVAELTINNSYTFPTSDGASGQALVTNGSGVVSWSSAGSNNLTRGSFNVTQSSGTFNVDGGYNVGTLDVYYNGIKLLGGTDYTATNGTSFTLTNIATSGDVVEYVALNASTSAVGNTSLGSVTATNSQSVFNITNGYTVGGLAVFLNGVKLIGGVDFTATNGTSFTLMSPASSGDIVDYIAYGAVVASSNLQKTGDTMTGNLTIGNGSDLIVEGDLIVAKYKEGFINIGNSSTSKTIDITSGTLQTVILTGNCTFTMPPVEAGRSFTLLLKTGAGSFTSTFTGVKWPNNSAPTITTTASKLDILTFVSDGTNWYGNISQNYSV
jgi:hypothetical protein